MILKKVLPPSFKRFLLRVWRAVTPKTVQFQHVLLPPSYLRYGEAQFRTNEAFLRSAQSEVERLVPFRLTEKSRVLDVGCGSGRFAIGLIQTLGNISHYTGMDIMRPPINWANRYLASRNPNLHFLQMNVENERYNPQGQPLDAQFRFPFADASFDVVYCYSVFCHLIAHEASVYLHEFKRLITPDGFIFLTLYAEPDVPEVTINPENYVTDWGNHPRHCVRFNHDFVLNLIREAGLQVIDFRHKSEYDQESSFILGANKM